MQVVSIVVDVHEARSRAPGELERLGASVRFECLPAGDYDVGGGVLVERKTVRDLHLTVVEGRYWRQIGNLRRATAWPVVLIEGSRLLSGPIDAAAVRGVCLATSEQGVVVLRADDAVDSASWLLALARRAGARRRDRPRFAQLPKRSAGKAPEAMLAAVPGISTTTARALLREFGTVAAVAAARPAEWRRIPGMGERRSDSLRKALHESWPS